jgi:hypothetical protein
VNSILRRHKLLLLIPAVLLMGLFIGLIPLNMAHRLAGDCPFFHGKQAGWVNPCPFRSVTSDNEPQTATLNSVALVQPLQLSLTLPIQLSASLFSYTAFNSVPLRC